MTDSPTPDTPETKPTPKGAEGRGLPSRPANSKDARQDLEIVRKINKSGAGPNPAVVDTGPPSPFAKLAQNTPAAQCQSFVDLLNTPPAKADSGAVSFGEYILTKRTYPGMPKAGSTWPLEDRKLIDSDIYRVDTGTPLAGPFLGKFEKPPAYLPTAQRVFGNTTFDVARNHNAILDADFGQLMRQNGIGPKESVGLINVDAHSDITEGGGNGGFSDWVDRALKANPNITEFYWVAPDDFSKGDLKGKYFPDKEPKEVQMHMQNSGKDKTLFVSKDGEVYWNNLPHDYKTNPGNYRIVQFHKRTLSEMPDMHGKKVILSTDLDYFDNRGFDTLGKAQVTWKGDAGFQQYLDTLDQKGIRPFYHFVSASPEYVRKEHMVDLLRFAAYVGDSSKNGVPTEFTHHNDYREAYGSRGIVEPIQGNRGAEMVWRLFSNDLKTTQPDGRIVVDKLNDERTAAIRAAMKIYKVNWQGGLRILRNLDAADGTADGVINFRLIENEAGKVCRDK